MFLKILIKLMDYKTLVAGIVPVILGSVYSWYAYDRISLNYTVLLTIAMILIQSATNMINDYFDYIKGTDGFEKCEEKALVSGEVSPNTVLKIVFVFCVLVLGIGIFIGTQTSYAILFVGLWGVLTSILYATGPMPISHTPLGEVVSGVTMGIGITTTTIYIQSGMFDITTVLVAIPTTVYIGTILLSNNLSDLKGDYETGRKTLPILIGCKNSEKLWLFNVGMIMVTTIVLTLLKLYPFKLLLMMVVLFPYKSIAEFSTYEKNVSTKGRTMGLIGKIGVRYHVTAVSGLLIAGLLR